MTDYHLGRNLSELRAAIDSGYDLYLGELGQAGPHWERKPGTGEGEDAWCARQVAEHLAGASGFFAVAIAKQINIEAPTMQRFTFDTADAAAAAAGMPAAQANLMGVVGLVPEDSLDRPCDFPPLGEMTLGNLVGIVSHHLNDHAQQLRTLREG